MNPRQRKLLIVFGTRPEAIKLAPLIQELGALPEHFALRLCVTAQHRDMLDPMLRAFRIRPHYDLGVMQDRQEPREVVRRCLHRLRPVLEQERPDGVLVQGDTTTALAAALAAFYGKVPVAHVEAGLRSGDAASPFPEEMNRRLISQLADLHFAPTVGAQANLLREGISPRKIHVTGNTGIDALFGALRRRAPSLRTVEGLERWRGRRPLALVTCHRRETFGDGFERTCQAVRRIAEQSDVDIIFPVHRNPQVRFPARKLLGHLPNVFLIAPLDYLRFVALMQRARLILTDSGGIQEEAPSLGKPVLVLREETERLESVEAGNALLVGTDPDRIAAEAARLLENSDAYAQRSRAVNLYGDGQASQRIARILAAGPVWK